MQHTFPSQVLPLHYALQDGHQVFKIRHTNKLLIQDCETIIFLKRSSFLGRNERNTILLFIGDIILYKENL